MSFSVDSFTGLTPVLTATDYFDDWDWDAPESIECPSDHEFVGHYRAGQHAPERPYDMADYVPTGTGATYVVIHIRELLGLGGPDGYFNGCDPAVNGFPDPDAPIFETIALDFTPTTGTIYPTAGTYGPDTELRGYLRRPTLAYHGDLTNGASVLLWPIAEALALSVTVSFGSGFFGGVSGTTTIQLRTFSGVDPFPDEPPEEDPGTIVLAAPLSGALRDGRRTGVGRSLPLRLDDERR